jgi:antitoxin component YwqK of YwqJK toxin-antitoxin module
MKLIALLLLSCTLFVACEDTGGILDALDDALDVDVVKESELQERGSLGDKKFYTPNSQTPYTGRVMNRWPSTGKVQKEYKLKDGKKQGVEKTYYPSGGRKSSVNYKDGKKHGEEYSWGDKTGPGDFSGQKELKANYVDGKMHGLKTTWDMNGQKSKETNYKDGKLHGLKTTWDRNGEKIEESNYKDGKLHGLYTEYWELGTGPNYGQKRRERMYRDGKPVYN